MKRKTTHFISSWNFESTNVNSGINSIRLLTIIAVFILSFFSAHAQYTPIPDANFEMALASYDDISGDGQVPTVLIETVTFLDVEAESIADLTGIEDFKALKILVCVHNNLTSVDLSNNTNLEYVFLDYNQLTHLNIQNGANTNIGELSALDNSLLTCILVDDAAYSTVNWRRIDATTSFSDTYCRYTAIPDTNFESALEDLGYDDISGDGQVPTANIEVVTSLDIRYRNIADLTGIGDFKALTTLLCFNNNLTSLDLSNNTNLEFVSMENNQLTYINIQNGANTNITSFIARNNSALTCIAVDDENYSTTNWTSIDSQTNFTEDTYCRYTSIPDANFESALGDLGYDDVSGDGQVPTTLIEGITTLNIRSKSISDLTGIEDFTTLTGLDCIDNSLTSLDLSNNTNLEEIYLEDNQLAQVNIRNGANTNITKFSTWNNSLLTCVMVDDATYSVSNWLDIEDQTQFTNTDYCDYTAIPDTEFEIVLEVYGYDDISGDGQVPTDLIETMTTLNVTGHSISDLTGIEDFRDLTTLTNIGGRLTYLDLSNNTNLESINLINNKITYLNIRNGANTNITFFDVKGNNVLTCIFVDDATYSNANWNRIDSQTQFTDTNYCDYTVIPDANFESALEDLGYDDISGDGQVPTDLIETVSSLIVNSKGIADLTGIEDFVSLRTLVCSQNNLTSLDVSNNIDLETLWIEENSISSIDLSNNTALKNLTAHDNSLTSIDLSANTELISLLLSDNSLTTLDVTANTKLKSLGASDNLLSSIDVSANTVLEKLWVENNELSTISVINCLSLKELNCLNNVLTMIDLTNNTALESLDMAYNTIEDLDLTKHVNLKYFYANGGTLKSLNVQNGTNTNILGFYISNNPDLTCVLVDDATYSTANWTNIDNQTSFNEVSCTVLSIENNAVEGLQLYPNPTTGKVFITQDVTEVKLYNITGQQVLHIHDKAFDMSHLASGVYFAHIFTDKGNDVLRIVKE